MTDELPGLGRYIDALAAPVAIDEVTSRSWRSRPRRALAFAAVATVLVVATTVIVFAIADRGGEPAPAPPAGVSTAASTSSTSSSSPSGPADIVSAPLDVNWVNDIATPDTGGLRVIGNFQSPCHSAALNPESLRLFDRMDASCDDPRLVAESVAPVESPILRTNNATLSIARVDPASKRVTTGPVVMTFGSYSDTRPIWVYGGDWLWIYDVETIPHGAEVLQVSRTTGAVVNTVAMPTLYRPLLAASDDGLWVGESVQGGQCPGCGPPPSLTFVAAGAHRATRVDAAGATTTYWLHADGHHVWASVGSFTHREVMRFDGTDLRPVFRTPESDLNVFNVEGDARDGLWSVAPTSTQASADHRGRFEVVRIDPATGREQRLVKLPASAETASGALSFAVFDGSVFVLTPRNPAGFDPHAGGILRVTPR